MNDNHENISPKGTMKALYIIWGVLLFSLIIYVGAGLFLQDQVKLDINLSINTLKYIFTELPLLFYFQRDLSEQLSL